MSAYEDCTWENSHIDWPDRAKDAAVEALVIRPDGETLAIEHTLIESFAGEREDLERFKRFLHIEDDSAFLYSETEINVEPHPTAW